MVTIEHQIVTQAVQNAVTWSGTNQQTSITVHETANTSVGAGAQAHANLQANGNSRQASWHIQVDDTRAIRSFPNSAKCWHAGRRAENSIAVEICVNADSDYEEAFRNGADVVKQLREALNISRSNVVDHHYWSGKNCPAIIRRDGRWEEFLNLTDGSSGGSSGGSSKSVAQLAQEVIDGRHGTGNARRRSLGSQYDTVQAEVNRRLSGGSTGGSSKSVTQLAQEVIDGRHGSGDARRRSLGSRYSAVQAEVNRRLSGGSTGGSSKSVSQLAQEVIDGRHGSGNARRKSLGSQYATVQAEVNRRLSGSSGGSSKSVTQLAQEVIDGRHGTGDARRRSLGSRYNAVQAEVNRRLS